MDGLYDYKYSIAGNYLSDFAYIWQALPGLADYILRLGTRLDGDEYIKLKRNVWVSRRARLSPDAFINGPCIICEGAELRHSAFIRGSVIVGRGAVIGNSCEIKNSVLFDRCQLPHFNYAGDSVIGYRAHFGAGSVTSNLKCDQSEVVVRSGKSLYYTGMRKLGALVGDCVQLGCNVTLNPGTVIGRGTVVYPNLSIRGAIPENSICKSADLYIEKRGEKNG